MFSPFSDSFLSDYLEEQRKIWYGEQTMAEKLLIFASDDPILPNLSSPDELPQTSTSPPAEVFGDDNFSEINLNSDEFSPEIFNDEFVFEATEQQISDVLENPLTDDDSQSSDEQAGLEILKNTAHDHVFDQKRLVFNKNSFTIKNRNFPVSSANNKEQKQNLSQYCFKTTTTKSEDFDIAREITLGGAAVGRSSYTFSNSRRRDYGNNNQKTRGAMYAKMYREKNKAIVDDMQQNIDRLHEENSDLKQTVDDMDGKMTNMRQEIRYLRSVLANQSALSGLLKNTAVNKPGMKFRFPLVDDSTEVIDDNDGDKKISRKRKTDDIDDNCGNTKFANEGQKSDLTGVCLHVNGDSVSLEFCARCARDSRCDP